MKRLLPLLLLLAASLFTSCIGNFPEVAVCKFPGYEAFKTNMTNWKEPDSYSFTYDLWYGDSFVTYPVKVTVKNGNSTFEFEGNDEDLNEENIYFGSLKINSITDLYQRIDSHWEKVRTAFDKNGDKSYVFNVDFETLDGYGMYPVLFNEDQFRIKVKEDYNGYGGLYIKVLNIIVDSFSEIEPELN